MLEEMGTEGDEKLRFLLPLIKTWGNFFKSLKKKNDTILMLGGGVSIRFKVCIFCDRGV